MSRALSLAFILASTLTIQLQAQTKPSVPPTEYGQWETLVPGGALSPDGKWIAFGVNRANRNNELRISNIGGGEPKIIAFGLQPAFSSDSKWAAYGVAVSESQEEKLKKEKKPIQRKLGLLNLLTGEQITIDGVESFAFSPNGGYLAMRRYAPERKDPPPPDPTGENDVPQGSTLIVRQLSSGRDMTFGNIGEYSWQDLPKSGRLLAFTINAENKTGNAVQLYEPETGALRVLDSSASIYRGLAWRKESGDLAVLKSKSDDRREGATQIILSWKRLGDSAETSQVYDPAADAKFPTGMRTVPFRRPSWSDEGETIFVGLGKWPEKAPAGETAEKTKPKDEEEQPGVDVWHSRDIIVMPKQKIDARSDRQRNSLAALHLETKRLVQLGEDPDERVTPIKRQKLGLATNWSRFAMERTIGRPSADLYLVDLTSGERTKIKESLNEDYYVQASPGGRYLLFFENDHYWTINTATRSVVNITKNVQTSFVNRESDVTIKQKPAFGVAGWTKNDDTVILYDKFDLWQIKPDGSRAKRLTDGAAEQVRHRYIRLNPDEEWIDPEKGAYLSLFGIWSKKEGYARLRFGDKPVADRLVWLDKNINRLMKAKDAEIYAYTVENFDDSPDFFVGDGGLKDAKQVTNTNAFQTNFAWGRSEVVEYKIDGGERMQGALFYPANYEAGKKYPMVVYLYERLSDGVHRYSSLSERDYYNVAAFTQQGYFLFEPDIKFQPREPGRSVIACVTPAVNKVIEMGLVDAKKIGVVGHSWGGFDASYLATHSDLFAAAVAGAPITNLVSNYGNHHWNTGIAETDHIETGQQRMEVPLWEDLQAYIRNSAVYNVQNMKTPLLIEVGDKDGVVYWHQGVELYNLARRAKKNVVLLVYADEDHGLRKKANQIDYHRRIQQWFAHYLKGEPALTWISTGQSFLDREEELKRLKTPKEQPKAGQ
jgi:dipeptidyl aminopeptidase/acylaminoacyl peptidase